MSRRRDLAQGRRGERSGDLGELLSRKRELIERCAAQRAELAQRSEGLRPALAAGDRVVGWVRAHPFLLAGAGALLILRWPRRTFALASRAFAAWQGIGVARRLLGER